MGHVAENGSHHVKGLFGCIADVYFLCNFCYSLRFNPHPHGGAIRIPACFETSLVGFCATFLTES